MTRVGFSGPYADVNFGDYAMLINNIAALGIDDATVFSYDDVFLNRVLSDYFPMLERRVINVQLRDLDPQKSLQHRDLTGIEALALLHDEDKLRAALDPLDVLVVNGGGYLNELWARPHRQTRLLQILVPALLAAEMGKKVVFSANGLGPFGPALGSLANLLAGMPDATIHIRDRLYSPMWARRLGLPPASVRHAPDDLLLIDPVIAARRPTTSAGSDRSYVVVETYQALDGLDADLPIWRRFVELMDTQGRDVVFLPLHLGAGGTDQALMLSAELGLPWVDIRGKGYLPIEDALSIIRGADLVVSGRYHALVLALAVGTPVLSVLREVAGDLGYYYSKNAGVLRAAREGAAVRERDYLTSSMAEAFERAGTGLDDVRLTQAEDLAHTPPSTETALARERQQLLETIMGESR